MFLKLATIESKKLVGKRLTMSYANNKTGQLWGSFMPERKNIKNAVTTDLISMQVYPAELNFSALTLDTLFEKWAVTEVSDFDQVPENMETFTLPAGLYAVFLHKGSPAQFQKIFHYIFQEWLPASGYETDERPHFELLDERYKNNSEDSEEEIWLPVKQKH